MDSEQATPKTAPVILITGTPGTGKTTHAQLVAEQSPIPMRHISVGDLVKEKDLHEGYDEEWQSYTVNEDKVAQLHIIRYPTTSVDLIQLLDELEPIASAGGIILDWHTCDMFPERWIDLVVVLRCDHTQLWDRLEKRYIVCLPSVTSQLKVAMCRGYPLKKIQENNESELMQVVLEDARESYAPEIVVELRSESTGDLEENATRIVEWIQAWKINNTESQDPEGEVRAQGTDRGTVHNDI